MVESLFVASAATGAILLAVALATSRVRPWRRYSPTGGRTVGGLETGFERDAPAYRLTVVMLAVSYVAIVYFLVQGLVFLPEMFRTWPGVALAVPFVGGLLGFATWGVYEAVLARGGSRAAGTAVAGVVFGGLVVALAVLGLLLS